MSVVCPECDNPLDIDLEVVSSDPLELAPVDEEGYDDEDDDPRAEDDEEEE
jgi:alpha-aminoadipate carrier protein LysW